MRNQIKVGLFLLMLVGLTFVVHWHTQNAQVVQAYNADNLIRFHVIANSDSKADQALKLNVRDKVVQAMTPEFSQAQGVRDARTVVMENLNNIREVAHNEIKNHGQNYPVSVSLGNYMFPTKTYGDLTLPQGKYEAVRVVIGEGSGANWWCVLFPPLCFVDLSADQDGEFRFEEISDPPDKDVINISNKEEYKSLSERTPSEEKTESEIKQTEPQIEVKFKVVEVFEDSVTRVARVLGKHLALNWNE